MCKPANQLHEDGTVTYWSVYRQQWITEPIEEVPDREWVAWSSAERARAARKLRELGR